MSVDLASILVTIFSNPCWKVLLIIAVLAFIGCFVIKGKKIVIPIIVCIASVSVYIVTAMISGGLDRLVVEQTGESAMWKGRVIPEFSDKTMFSLRIYEPWFYESLHYTLECDGTLIVQYYDTELGREKLSDEKMEEIKELFSPKKVYKMNVGKENNMTDGVSRYIILYDSDENEIEIGGYELEGGDDFNDYFSDLYNLLEDDYTKQWSDKLAECNRDCVTYRERYLDNTDPEEPDEGGEGSTPDDSSIVGNDEVGIDYSYWLRLDNSVSDDYETVVDDISYKLTYYGNYITVYITNNGASDALIGGEYHLQRQTGGQYTEISDDANLIYGGVHVRDMPRIILHDNDDGSEITLADDEDTFVIKPGQTIKAEFLTLHYAIFDFPEYEGGYRFIFGDVVIDFKLYCDTVC